MKGRSPTIKKASFSSMSSSTSNSNNTNKQQTKRTKGQISIMDYCRIMNVSPNDLKTTSTASSATSQSISSVNDKTTNVEVSTAQISKSHSSFLVKDHSQEQQHDTINNNNTSRQCKSLFSDELAACFGSANCLCNLCQKLAQHRLKQSTNIINPENIKLKPDILSIHSNPNVDGYVELNSEKVINYNYAQITSLKLYNLMNTDLPYISPLNGNLLRNLISNKILNSFLNF
jgi:hypothetical protein